MDLMQPVDCPFRDICTAYFLPSFSLYTYYFFFEKEKNTNSATVYSYFT